MIKYFLILTFTLYIDRKEGWKKDGKIITDGNKLLPYKIK